MGDACGEKDYAADMKDSVNRVVSNDEILKDVWRMEIESPSINLLKPVGAGRFVMIYPKKDSMILGRSFAVAELAKESFSVWYMAVGRGTRDISTLKPGDSVKVRGPLGNPFPVKPGADVIMVSGTLGAAALAVGYGRDTCGFHIGVPDGSWSPFIKMLRNMVPDARVFSEDGTLGESGSALSGLPAILEEDQVIWGCGTPGMLKAMAARYKDQLSKLYLSFDSKMACGYGGCAGCVIDTVRGKLKSCSDGPVFCADEVLWDVFQ